jgi:hypothetical protein
MGGAFTNEIDRTRNRGGVAFERTLISIDPLVWSQSLVVSLPATDHVARMIFVSKPP